MKSRKQYTARQKASVALAAVKGQQTINEIASEFGVHPTQVTQWKKHLQDQADQIFVADRGRQAAEDEAFIAQLYQEIGQLKYELDWLKKKSGLTR